MKDALLAIVELHRPIDNEVEKIYPQTYFKGPICSQCRSILYPCPTILALESSE